MTDAQKIQHEHIIKTALTNIAVVYDQIDSIADEADYAEIVKGLKHARAHMQNKLKELA